MGKNTFNSLGGKPLSNRINFVVSNTLQISKQNLIISKSLNESLELINNNYQNQIEDIYIIGGSKLYKEALSSNLCKYVFCTRIYKNYDCDTFLESDFLQGYKKVNNSHIYYDNGVPFAHYQYEKI